MVSDLGIIHLSVSSSGMVWFFRSVPAWELVGAGSCVFLPLSLIHI